jgi:hypothetical protein
MKALEELGTTLIKEWAGKLSAGLIFFSIGVALVITQHTAWSKFLCWVQNPSALPQILLFFIGLSSAALIFGHIVEYLTDTVIRGLEGYWPSCFASLARRCVDSKLKSLRTDEKRFEALARKIEDGNLMRNT